MNQPSNWQNQLKKVAWQQCTWCSYCTLDAHIANRCFQISILPYYCLWYILDAHLGLLLTVWWIHCFQVSKFFYLNNYVSTAYVALHVLYSNCCPLKLKLPPKPVCQFCTSCILCRFHRAERVAKWELALFGGQLIPVSKHSTISCIPPLWGPLPSCVLPKPDSSGKVSDLMWLLAYL